MKTRLFLRCFQLVLLFSCVYTFTFTATAQNYYPADIGNTWVLESIDDKEQITYSLEGPETINGTELIALKIKTDKRATGDVDIDQYFLSVSSEAVKLHKTVLQEAAIGVVTADLPTPATFFPLNLKLGDKWKIEADAEVKMKIGLTVGGTSTTHLEVIGFEDLKTPAGTFQDCAKVKLALKFSATLINIESTTYQWLAPNLGPVQYRNSNDLLFKLVDSNLLTEPNPYDVTGDGVVNILDLTFVASRFGEMDPEADVTGDGMVNILDLVSIAQNFAD